MQLVDGIVRRSSEQLSESTGLLQDILKAAADQEVRGALCCWHLLLCSAAVLCCFPVCCAVQCWWHLLLSSVLCCTARLLLDAAAPPLPLRLSSRSQKPRHSPPQTGEWQLPLQPDRLEAMRGVMAANAGGLDESLLASCYSWMRKASEDKLDGEGLMGLFTAAAPAADVASGCARPRRTSWTVRG